MINESSAPVPVTLVTGFLGSGKTTIIAGWLKALKSQGENVVFIKNEIGSENIDAQLLGETQIKTRELLNGCICCTLVGPFASALQEVIATYHPDRLIIEASGAADPSAIALMLSSTPGVWREAVVSVIDVLNFEGYIDISFTAQQQARFTDLIVFNKVELASGERKRAVVGYVRELNATAPIIEAPHGEVRPSLIFGFSQQAAQSQLDHLLQTETHDEHEAHHHHLETDHIQTVSFEIPNALEKSKLQNYLESLPKNVFRVKGFVKLTTGEILSVNKVGTRIELGPAPSPTDKLRLILVLIGFEIEAQASQLKTALLN